MNISDVRTLILNEKNISHLKEVEDNSFNIKKLLGTKLTQSQSIKFGNIFQTIIKDIVKSKGGEVLTQKFADVYGVGETKLNKGHKDIDIWFLLDGKMYYFEAKTNLDLDSEKSKATDTKVEDITQWMKNNYVDYEIYSGVLSCWWDKEPGLPVKVKNVVFMKEFFEIIGVDISSEEYYHIMKEFGQSLK